MPSIDDIRKANPAVYGGLTEYEIVDRLSKLTGKPSSVVMYDLGVKAPNEGGFTTAVKGGLGGMVQSVGQLGADFFPGVDPNNMVERYGREVAQRNPLTIMEGESESGFSNLASNLMERPLNTAGQIAGSALSFATPGAALKVGSAGLRAMRGIQGAAGLGTNAAVGSTTILPSYGQMRDEQELAGMNTTADKLKALGSSAIIGAIETAAGPEAMLLRGGKAIAPSRSLKGAILKQGGLEASEEVLQAPFEAYGSGRDVFTAKTLDDAAAGALAGFVGGGLFGAGSYPFVKNSTATKLEQRDPVNLSDPDSIVAPDYTRRLDRVNSGRAVQPRDVSLPEVMTVTPTGDVLTTQAQIDAWNEFGRNNQQFTIDFDRARTKKMLRNSLDAQLASGVITDEQHQDAYNEIDLHTGAITKLKDKLKPILAPALQVEEQIVTPVQKVTPVQETNLVAPVAAPEVAVAEEVAPLTFDAVASRTELTDFLNQQLAQEVITPEQHQEAIKQVVGWKKSFPKLKEKIAPTVAVAEVKANATPDNLAAFRKNMGDMLRQSLTDLQYNALVATRGVRNMDDTDWEVNPATGAPMAPMSNAAAGAEQGAEAKKISARANTALKKLHSRAKELGMSPEAAELVLGVQGEQVAFIPSISKAQAAQAGLSFRDQPQQGDVSLDEEGNVEDVGATAVEDFADEADAAAMASEEAFAEAADEFTTADVLMAKQVWELMSEELDVNEVSPWADLSEDAQQEFVAAVRRNRINPRGEASVAELQALQQGAQNEQGSGVRKTTDTGTEVRTQGADVETQQATTTGRKKRGGKAVGAEVVPKTKRSMFKDPEFPLKTKPKFANLRTWTTFLNALVNDYQAADVRNLRSVLNADEQLSGLDYDTAINMLETAFDNIDYSIQAPNRTVGQVVGQLKAMFKSSVGFDNLVTVFKNDAEMKAAMPDKVDEKFTQGFVEDGRVYLVVDNIPPGQEFSVLMHELGVHMGIIGAVSSTEFNRLSNQIKQWAQGAGTAQEQKLARSAMKRMEDAREGYAERGVDAERIKTLRDKQETTSLLDEELVAYFVDAAVTAGVNPQALSVRKGTKLGKWFSDLINIITNALKKLKLQTNAPLTAQDFVDLAYGLAQLTLEGDIPARPSGVRARSEMRDERSAVSRGKEKISNYTNELIDELPPGVADSVRYTQDAASDMAKRGLWYSMFTNDLVSAAEKAIPSVRRWYNLVKTRATEQIKREAIIDEIANEVDQLSRPEFERTWNAILEMTGNQKWGYQPTWRNEVTIDPEMEALYNELSENEQAIVDRVFKHGYDDLKATQDVLDNILNTEFEQKLKEAKTPEERATIARQERKFKEMFGRKLSQLEGPYAPMRRVGSHVVVARSQALMDAIENKDTKLIDEMRTDPRHYQVMFFDSMAEAKREERKLVRERKFPANGVRSSEKDAFASSIQMLPFEAFEQIRQMASEKEGDAAKKLSNLVTELYLTSLAETSARKSELRRETIAGLNSDTMYKAFVSKGRASAHYIANLKNNREIGNAMAQMRQEAKENTDMVIFNELAKRYANNLKFDPAPVASKIMAFNAIWSLLTKPAYYVYNATQPALMTLPLFTQKFKYTEAAAAMTQAYKDIAAAKNFLNINDASIHIESMPEDVRRVLQDLLDSGKLDINITQDLGARLAAGQGDISRAAANVSRVLRTAAQKVETANRLVTAIAAYRLAKPTMTHEEAVNYAAEVIDSTQGDYSNFNAPRLFNQTAFQRVATQFRKFQLIQVTFIVKMVKQAFAGASKAERAAAIRSLGFVLGHHAILAGALGLPAANIIAFVYAASADDDEPRDLEVDLRKALGNDFMADLVTRGAPAAMLNLNVSANVGMGQAFSLIPFAEGDLTTREGYASAVVAGMGPFFGGVMPQMLTAMGSIYKGDYYKGLEGLMPSGARTALRSLREATEGVTNTRGDELVSPDEVSLFHSVAKALGFRTNDDAVRQLIRSKSYEFDQFFKDRTSELKNQYAKAYRDGDTEAMIEARESWNEMNQFKRDYGFTVQPISNLLKAPMERGKRESQTIGGVQTTKANRGFVQSLTETEE